MASVKEFIEAGREYARQIAASNPIITTKPASIWFEEIADKAERDQAIEEMTLEYNLSLLDGEEPMSEAEMAEIIEVSGVERNCSDCCECEKAKEEAKKQNRAIAAEAQKPKYCDWDMMLKDDEIALLKQRVDYLESKIDRLRERGYGVNWRLLRRAWEDEKRKRRQIAGLL